MVQMKGFLSFKSNVHDVYRTRRISTYIHIVTKTNAASKLSDTCLSIHMCKTSKHTHAATFASRIVTHYIHICFLWHAIMSC